MIALHAARVLAEETLQNGWWVTIDGPAIVEVGPEPKPDAERIDLGDVDLVAGFVDLHSDCLERFVHPRPNVELSTADALFEYELNVLASGITTNFLCISLEGAGSRFRTSERGLATFAGLQASGGIGVDQRVHLRVDITSDEALALVPRFLGNGRTTLVSYMDHTPGQGQYTDEAQWRASYGRNLNDGDTAARIAQLKAGQVRGGDRKRELSALAREAGAVLAAHDDDDRRAVEDGIALGARVSEFPVTLEAAAAAHELGAGTVMGAPNARRGHSHVANVSARDAVRAGTLDALASDYHPASMLAAADRLTSEGVCSWERALALISAGPARIAGLGDRGRIAPGLRADLVAIARHEGRASVAHVWTGGERRFSLAIQAKIRSAAGRAPTPVA